MKDDVIIQVDNLHKAFGERQIYAGLSLDVRRGESLCVLGGSGTGKSVLLRILLGLERADQGTLSFGGEDITHLDERGFFEIRKRMAMAFQNAALFDSMTVAENVAYPLRQQRKLDDREIDAKVKDMIGRVGLEEAYAKLPAELSGGMKKRVAIARAIVAEPEVLLLDEPTAGLDPPTTRKIDELLRTIQRTLGITIVTVTHDLETAYFVADRIAMLSNKKIVALEPTADFRKNGEHAIREFTHAMAQEEAA
jgi:phospholipid/cholesterol/gamma-HCH transport system ATP-binding protein